MTKQVQKGGDQSTNVQAENVTIVQGITLSDAREIALDVFRSNFNSMVGRAADVASLRADEIIEKFLKELQEQNPIGLQQAEDPDFQYALFTVQKEYARSGDKGLGDILVDILVDRTKEVNRSLLQIVLNESLQVASKLTKNQLDALSVIFSLKYTRYLRMVSLDELKHYLDYRIAPFVPELSKSNSCYQHLEYVGCGSIGIGSLKIESTFRNMYPGIFTKGFPESEISKLGLEDSLKSKLFIKCLQNPTLFQINAVDEETLKKKIKENNIADGVTSELLRLQINYLMSEEEIKVFLKTVDPCMEKLFDVWDNSYMKNMTLTSVGIAIGHANTRRITKETDDLSIWIN